MKPYMPLENLQKKTAGLVGKTTKAGMKAFKALKPMKTR